MAVYSPGPDVTRQQIDAQINGVIADHLADTIGALTALTDDTGLSGSHNDTVAAITAGTALVLSNMGDGSANNTLIAIGDTSMGNESDNIEQNFDKIGDEVNAHTTALGVVAQNVSDLAQKINEIIAAV